MTKSEKIGLCIALMLLIVTSATAGITADTIKPVITVEASDLSATCNNVVENILTTWYNDFGGAMATDNSGMVSLVPNLTLQQALDTLNANQGYSCGFESFVTVSWTAIDACANQSINPTTATFYSEDTTGPVFIVSPMTVSVDCDQTTQDSLNQWIANFGNSEVGDACSDPDSLEFFRYIATDNLGVSTIGDYEDPVNVFLNPNFCYEFISVSFWVRDQCGNQTIESAQFMISDTVDPVWSQTVENEILSCEESTISTIVAIDECVGQIFPVITDVSSQGSDPSNCNFYNYVIERHLLAFDPCGNSIEAMHLVVVRDTTAPSFDLETDITIDCTEVFSSESAFGPTNVVDNCNEASQSFSDTMVGDGCSFVIERVWSISDLCGNVDTRLQVINVIDSSPPVLINSARDTFVTCQNLNDIPSILSSWLSNSGYGQAIESCSAIQSFQATPGSYDLNDSSTFPGQLSTDMVHNACPSTDGYLSSVSVDFVFHDGCGNAVMTNADFGILDNQMPQILACPNDTLIGSTGANCEGVFSMELLDVMDNCVLQQSPLTFAETKIISSSDPGNQTVPVDSVLYRFGPLNLISNPAIGAVNMTLDLVKVDSEENNEFFIIKSEQGVALDSTGIFTECGSASFNIDNLTAAQINLWAADGFIEFWLVPNLPNSGVFSINDICDGSSGTMNLSFDIDVQNSIQAGYSLDQIDTNYVALNSFPLELTLNSGVHTLEYFFRDCGGNVAKCIHLITVEDESPPTITCPDNETIDLPLDVCELDYRLSLDFDVDDNCGLPNSYQQTLPNNSNSAFLNFELDPVQDTLLADDLFFTFVNVQALNNTGSEITLTINLTGDIDDAGEYFEIYGEGGELLGNTDLGSSNGCGTSRTRFKLDQNLYNQWAIDGQILITAVAPNSAAISGGGINNCNPLISGEDNDGVSDMYATLNYTDSEVYYNVNGATQIGSTLLYPDGVDSIVTLNGGVNVIEYITTDDFGNTASCSYEVLVRDTQDPEIECIDHVVFVHPSGLIEYELSHSLILLDSTDNCGIVNYVLSEDTFDCSQAGQIIAVTVIATDEQGNSSSCVSQIRVETPVLIPSYTAGICIGDTLSLFANVPEVSVANAYTFSWTGPDNFVSNLENPIIPSPDADNNGTYVLTVEGFGQCISEGTVEVFIQQLTTPELSTPNSVECISNDLILSATSYSGNVQYLWYEGIAPSGVLLQTTTIPNITINPSLGVHNYFVEVSSPDCATLPSLGIAVEVVEVPLATVQAAFITLCEGEDIVLGTDVFDPNYEYKWTGPNGYSGTGQFPPAITDVTQLNQGLYNLLICNAACVSDTAITQVVVFDAPETPIISGDDIICEGATFVLTVNNVTNADQYFWYLNGVFFSPDSDNNLVNVAQQSLSGDWTVIIEDGLCKSDTSDVFSVFIEEEFQIGTSNSSNNGFLCEGDSVTVSATFIPDAQYIWESPNGDLSPGQSVTLEAFAGTYTVTVRTESGCETIETTTVFIDEIPTITALSNNSELCMDGMQDIQFFPTVVPSGNYGYEWSGPAGFGPTIASPIIPNASSIHNGVYTLVVTNGECVSEPEITIIDITDIPDQPVIESELLYCQGDELTVTTDLVGSAQYLWNTPLGDVSTSDSLLLVSDAQSNSEGAYTLTVIVNGCESEASDPINIQIQEQPNIPNAVSNSPVCTGDTLFFNTIQISNAVYEWEGPMSFNSNSKDPFIPNVQLNDAGTYNVRVTINGCSSEWNPINVEVIQTPETPMLAESVYSLCEMGSEGIEVCVVGSFLAGTLHTFYINGVPINTSQDLCYFLTPGELDLSMDNDISAQSEFMGCQSELSNLAQINIDDIPTFDAEAVVNEITLCDESTLDVSSVFGPPDVNVSWEALNDQIVLSNNDEITTTASNLPSGLSQIVLTYSTAACFNYSSDTISISNLEDPIALNDTLDLDIQLAKAIYLFENDIYVSDVTATIIQEPNGGTYELDNGLLTYTPDVLAPGEQVIQYEICYDLCPDLCSTAFLILNVMIDEGCSVPNIITPNGDGINDELVISCIATGLFDNNELKIFNQWGDQVFEAKPYLNNWFGIYNNVPLPVGTYFYIFDKGDGSKPSNGFIHLEK